MFVVPDKFNRNAPAVTALGAPADTGVQLLNYMCERIGIPDLAGRDVLDFGCGARFADSIINRNVPVGSYVGVDVYKEMIDFLVENATDPRLSFYHLDAENPLYNMEGAPLGPNTRLPVGDRLFDVLCMFSVITHQSPGNAASIFAILRRYAKKDGRLFFSAYLDDSKGDHHEVFPEKPNLLAAYAPAYLTGLLETAGWRVLSIVPRDPEDYKIVDSILCEPI